MGLIEVETQWSLNDLLNALDVLDLYEELDAKAAEKLKQK